MWEKYEGALAVIFSDIASPYSKTAAAMRAYGAVRTFEGRASMLEAAAESYFEEFPNEGMLVRIKETLRTGRQFCARRNDIAHGVVDEHTEYGKSPLFYHVYNIERKAGWCLYPPLSIFKGRHKDGFPDYCYSSMEVKYFVSEFSKMYRDLFFLRWDLGKVIGPPSP